MIRIERLSWAEGQEPLSLIRRRVFIEEQGVTEELEWDGEDAAAIHLLALEDGQPVGCLRLLADGHVGRMAVLRGHRRRGIGTQLMQAVHTLAAVQGLSRLELAAQTHALPFYTRLGYVAEGEEFLDAGIPHRRMACRLPQQ